MSDTILGRWRKSIAITTLVAVTTAGCSHSRVATVARMDAPTTQAVQPVRYGGVYEAKWTFTNAKHLKTIAGSGRYVHQGDQLGFERTPDGQLIGVHGDARVILADSLGDARYVVWYHRKTVPTQFGREMTKIGEGSLKLLQATAGAALIVGAVAAIGYYVYKNPDKVAHGLFNSDDDSGD